LESSPEASTGKAGIKHASNMTDRRNSKVRLMCLYRPIYAPPVYQMLARPLTVLLGLFCPSAGLTRNS
jgi:hypothetical protein